MLVGGVGPGGAVLAQRNSYSFRSTQAQLFLSQNRNAGGAHTRLANSHFSFSITQVACSLAELPAHTPPADVVFSERLITFARWSGDTLWVAVPQ